jgi:hypothetical protein
VDDRVNGGVVLQGRWNWVRTQSETSASAQGPRFPSLG